MTAQTTRILEVLRHVFSRCGKTWEGGGKQLPPLFNQAWLRFPQDVSENTRTGKEGGIDGPGPFLNHYQGLNPGP